jgi:hypothetical protein
MARCLLLFAVVALLAPALGCRTCANPYEECGPLYGGECGESCSAGGRVGSIIHPAPMPGTTGVPTGAPHVNVPGIIISETDQAVPAQGAAVSQGDSSRRSLQDPIQWVARPPEKTPAR